MSATDPAGPLDLHVDFYSRAAIDAAIGAFSRFGPFTVEARGRYHRVLLPAHPALGDGVLAREFANFVLAAGALGGAPAERERPA